MATETMAIEVVALHQKLSEHINALKLGVAGRVLYYDVNTNAFILAMHGTSPEKIQEATSLAWESIPEDLKAEMQRVSIGFAGKQI